MDTFLPRTTAAAEPAAAGLRRCSVFRDDCHWPMTVDDHCQGEAAERHLADR